MASINLSNSTDMSAVNEAGFAGGGSFSSSHFSFAGFGNFPSTVTALSPVDDITATLSGVPTGGTISAIISENGNDAIAYSKLPAGVFVFSGQVNTVAIIF